MIKVHSFKFNPDDAVWLKIGKFYVLQKNVRVLIDTTRTDGDKVLQTSILEAYFCKGFRCDGLSVPNALRWFLKDWDEDNMAYNLCGAVHDALYGCEGNVWTHYSRDECDDFFRGMLRESGIGRFKAGMADKCVGLFAKRHFKRDINVVNYFRMRRYVDVEIRDIEVRR